MEATENGKFCLACRGLPDWGGLGWGRQAKVDSTDAQDCGRGGLPMLGDLKQPVHGGGKPRKEREREARAER